MVEGERDREGEGEGESEGAHFFPTLFFSNRNKLGKMMMMKMKQKKHSNQIIINLEIKGGEKVEVRGWKKVFGQYN